MNKILGYVKFPDDDTLHRIKRKSLDRIIMESDFNNQNKYEIIIADPNERLLKVIVKQPILTYDKNEID